jgi:GT2 family glycosyltransferase
LPEHDETRPGVHGGSPNNEADPKELVVRQTQLISQLEGELKAANNRTEEAFRKLDLLEREKAEIDAALDSVLGSTGWRFLKKFRELKSRFLPPGTYRRELYDRVMIQFATSRPSLPRPTESSKPKESLPHLFDGVGLPFEQLQDAELPSCSIIIPVRNRSIFTKACLLAIEKSIRADRLTYEVIVVDNGSSDDTHVFLTEWSHSRTGARTLRLSENFGFARACNEGARMAHGRYIMLLNNDTLPTPGWLEKMMELAVGDAQVGIVGSKLLFPNGRIQHVGVAFDEAKNPGHIYRGFPPDIRPAKLSREYQAVTAACLLIERNLYWSVGGLEEAYENSYEDIDLCLKVRARGYRILLCGNSTVYHFESVSDDRRAHDLRNRALLNNRWANTIVPDLKSWYARDRVNENSTQFESHEAYHSEQETRLRDLWRKVYRRPFPDEDLSAVSGMSADH